MAKNYELAEGTDFPDYLEKQAADRADFYAAKTNGKTLLFTSGRRSAYRQAVAMYDNYKNNRNVGYVRADLEADIKKAFERGFKAPNTPSAITVAYMKEVIDLQISGGQYISKHLPDDRGIAHAADLSKDGVDKQALKETADYFGDFFFEEVHCYHLTFA